MSEPTHYVVSAAHFRTMLAATAGEHLYHGRALEVEFREAAIPVERRGRWEGPDVFVPIGSKTIAS